jgi:hypothetical protein
MKVVLKLSNGDYNDLIAHLLPPGGTQEQAAFLFAACERGERRARFLVTEARKLYPGDFAAQEGDYLELHDEVRARLIKRAHDLGASLVEIHSHLGPWPAAFSDADRVGLRETVPHMWWRLKKKPYLALVMTASGFDALVWIDNARVPTSLDGLLAGDRLLKPTNFSLGGWG